MMIEVNGVKKAFHQGGVGIEVLRGVSLQIEKGDTVALVGASGSGKSTLLSLLAGLDRPDEGTIAWKGQNLALLKEEALGAFRARTLSLVFQQFHLMSTLTALENVALPLEIQKDSRALEKAERALHSVRLSHRGRHFPHQMSGGECQRVAIARAFVAEPEILLADEPSGNLDVETGQAVMDLLFALVREKTMTLVLVTHNEPLAQRCQRQYALQSGSLVEKTRR